MANATDALSASKPAIWWATSPSSWACRQSWATARPSSYGAWTMTEPSGAWVTAQVRTTAAAWPAHTWLSSNSSRWIMPNVSSPRRPTMNRQGCPLRDDGAHLAASSIATSWPSATVRDGSSARGLQRSAISGCSGTSLGQVRLVGTVVLRIVRLWPPYDRAWTRLIMTSGGTNTRVVEVLPEMSVPVHRQMHRETSEVGPAAR